MPSFLFTSPDGKQYKVNGPEGATQEDAWGILQQQLGGASTGPTSFAENMVDQARARSDAQRRIFGDSIGPFKRGIASIDPSAPEMPVSKGATDIPAVPEQGIASLAEPQAPKSYTAEEYKAAVAKRNEESPSRSASDIAVDAGITFLKGVIGLPESFVGLADIPTRGYIGKVLEKAGYKPKEAKEILDTYLSEAQQAANRKVREAEGFGGTIQAVLQNPSTIATSVGESLPQMIGGAGIARGILQAAPKVGGVVAGGIGEGVLGAGSSAEQMRGESDNGLLTTKQALSALGSGVGTAVFGMAGGRLAQKLGLDDVDTMLATGSSSGTVKSVGDFAKRATLSGVSEGLFEEMPQSAQEKMWMNYATDKPILEGVPEAMGMGLVTGFAMGAVGGGAGSVLGKTTEGKTGPDAVDYENLARSKGFLTPAPAPTVEQGIAELLKQVQEEQKAQAPAAPPSTSPVAEAPPAVEEAPTTELVKEAIPESDVSQDLEAMLAELEDQIEGKSAVPKKVYRGQPTGAEFKDAGDGNIGAGFYTTESEQAAKEFASRHKDGTVLQGELLASRVLDIDSLDDKTIEKLKSSIPTNADGLLKYGWPRNLYDDQNTRDNTTKDLEKIHNELDKGQFNPRSLSYAVGDVNIDTLGQIYKAAGYDAVSRTGDALKSGTKYKEYVTFSPESQKMQAPKAQEPANINTVKVAAPSTELVEQVAAPVEEAKTAPVAEAPKRTREEQEADQKAYEAARKGNGMMPMQDGNRTYAVPLSVFGSPDLNTPVKLFGDQTLAQVIQRGGIGTNEAIALLEGNDQALRDVTAQARAKYPEVFGQKPVAAPKAEAAPAAAPAKQAPKAQAPKTKVSEEEKLVDIIKEAAYKPNSWETVNTTVDDFIAKHGKKTFERAVELGLLDNKIGDGRLFPSNKFAYDVSGNYYDQKGKKLKQPIVATAEAPAQPVAEDATQEAQSPETDEKAKAKQDLEDALGDLAWLATKPARLGMMPEEEQKLMPILARVMDAAFRLGHIKFKEAARFVMDTIRSRLGDDAADKITLDHLQGAYISMAGKYQDQGASSKKDVVAVESLDELAEAAAEEPAGIDLSSTQGAFKVAQNVSEFFLDGGSFANINEARKMISDLTGQDIKPGTKEAKQADEAVEVGVVLAAKNIVEEGRKSKLSSAEIYDQLVNLYNSQPNLGVRSSTSVANQAYSTPAPLAFIASELAGIDNKTTVYEPTAGNGMLTIGAKNSNVVANELNKERFDMLKLVLDGAEVVNKNGMNFQPDLVEAVIANPPFGAIGEEVEISGKKTREIDHAISYTALSRMQADGKAVLIVGGVQSNTEDGRREGYRGKAKREFYYNLYKDYNVVDHFTVGGNMYSKQGASYPVDVIVIDGKGQSSRNLPAADLPQLITSYEQLKEKLNDRMVSGEAGRPGRADVGEAAAGEGEPSPVGGRTERQGERAGDEGRGTAGVGERGVQTDESAAGGQREPTGGRAGEEQPGAADVSERGGKGEPVAGTSESKRGSEAGTKGNRPSELGGVSVVSGERVGSGLKDRAGQEQETANQVSYMPHSRASSVGTLVPKAMADAIEASLAKVEAQVGNVDEYVAESLEMDPETVRELFSAEQVDALTLAIMNAEAGKGFIIGDQTGVGKGRVVAAMIRYALVHGKVPIFVTEKPNLYSDMIRDLDDIGMTDQLGLDTAKPKILITNSSEAIPYTLLRSKDGEITENNLTLKAPHTGAKLDSLLRDLQKNDSLGQYKVIFTTYSQLQNIKGKGTERQNFIKHFGAGNYMIFDESHNAGGAGAEPTKEGESQVMGRAGFVRSLVQNAFGTFFSSATYAKRPDVMDLYSSTDMSLAVDKMSDLSEAIQSGGIPMQQTVANMLTQVGQYIRRERTFAGVSYDTQETKVDKDTAENMATSMRDILAFSREKELVVKGLQKELDKQGARAGIEGEKTQIQSANFGSIMHNLIDQMLLSLKAHDSVRHAIERLKAGEKVVMTVSNTMGSFLQSYADEMKLVPGDAVNLSFSDLYKRYLEKQRMVTIKKPGGKKEEYRLTDEDLGPTLVAQYQKIANFIDNAGFGSAPISPIDYLHAELRKAGYKTEEITGRTVTLNYESGKPLLTTRSANIKQRVNAVKAFNSGAADVIILNQAGSTGLSLHASNKVKDQRKRHMIIVQPEKNIDTHMQMLGRVHRTGQVIPPAYSQMMADIPAEMRPAAVLLKKMASLNANTTASRKSAVSAEGAVDFMNDYGGQVAQEYLRDNQDVYEALGGNKIVQIKEDPTEADEADIRRLTGYIPILPIKQQEEIYKDIVDRYNDLIEREDSMGTNKLESKPMDLDAETLSSKQITEDKGEQSVFAQPAMMERVDVKRTVKPYSKEEVQEMVKENRAKQDSNDKMLWASIETKARAFGDKQIADMMAKEADPVRVTALQNQLQTQLTHVKTVLLNYPIGSQISVKNNNGVFVYGVVTDLEHKGKTKNPVAGSDWKMTIALANGDAKSINLTFSQIGSTYQLKAEGEVQYLNPETLKTEYIRLIDMFDKGATVRREKRWMVTGNILAGFAAVNNMGQIMTYTKDDGTTAQGILMPRTFDFEKQQKNAPVKLNSVDKVMAFFKEFGDGSEVATQNGIFKIQNRGAGRYRFVTSSSKREGGPYYLDSRITSVIGDFYKSGQIMSAMTYKEEYAKDVIQYLLDDRGDTLVANTNKDEARKVFQPDLANIEMDQTTLNPTLAAIADRKQMIAQLQSAKLRRAGVINKFIKGEAGLKEQARLTELTEISKSLKEAIKDTKPVRRSAGNFFADATKQWDEGNLSDAVYDVIKAVYEKYPFVLQDLKLTVRQPKQGQNAAGQYSPLARLVYLYKGTSGVDNPVTVRHELMHSLEQMMSEEAIYALTDEWQSKVEKAAKKDKSPKAQKFFDKLVAFYDNPSQETYKAALDELPSYDYYQYMNPSEYWAVNAEPLMARKLGSGWDKFVLAVQRLFEAMKNVFGFDNNYAVHKAFKEVMSGERKRIGHDALVAYVTSEKVSLENQNTRRNYKGKPAPLAEWTSAEESNIDNFIYRIQDKHIDTKRVQESITNEIGDIADRFDVYMKEELYHGRVAKQTTDFLKQDIQPLIKDMIDRKVSLEEFEEYLHNRAAPDRNALIASRNAQMQDGGSGIFNQEAADYMANLDPQKKKDFEALAAKADKIVKETQDLLVRNGLEKQETIDMWRKTQPLYVPLFRDKDELDFVSSSSGMGAGFSSGGRFTKTASGSLKTVVDIFGNIALQRERAIVRSEKARVGRALYGLAISSPNPDFWMPINPSAIKNKKKLIQELINLGLRPDDAENIIQEPRVPRFDKKTGQITYEVNLGKRSSENVLSVRVNGEDRFIFFNPGDHRALRMVEALKNLDADQLSGVMGITAELTRTYAAMNTQYNPVFGAWNFARDTMGAAVNLNGTPLENRKLEVFMDSFPALRAIYRDLREKGSTTPEMRQWIDLFERFQQAGGQTGYREQFSRHKERATIIQRELENLNAGNARKTAKVVFDWLSDYNDAMENAVRLSAFKAALDEGMSEERAASLAKNLTVNFNRKGEAGTWIGALYAFFNAAVQGTARMGKLLVDRSPDGTYKLSKSGKKIIAGGSAIGVAQAVALAMGGFDEDEPPDFLKNKNIIIPTGGGKYLIIPMPLGLNVFPNVGRTLTEFAMSDRKDAGKLMGKLFAIVLDSFNPLGSSGLAQTIAPTLVDPLVALSENKDPFGRPISKENRATNPTPGYERSRENATAISKGLAYALNYLTGGGQYGIGLISPTADQLDFLAGQYAGGVGRELAKGARFTSAVIKGDEIPSYKVPIAGKLYGETGSPAAITDKFYKNVTMLAEHEGVLRRMREDRQDTGEYRRENPEVNLIKTANNLENRVSKLNRTKKELLEKEQTESVKAQIKRIEEQKTRIMKDFNDRVKRVEH